MKWINNFTSNKHVANTPFFDIMVWYVSVYNAKLFGYTTKLYCTPKDVDWLEKRGILSLYDEVDVDFLSDEGNYPDVDQTKFWSIRKLICINHEFEISDEPFVFADVDVVLFRPLELGDADLGVWSPDPYGPSAPIYCDWKYLSAPPHYRLPSYVRDVKHAYNCGILYFREARYFRTYYRHFLDWTVGNPCRILVEYEADGEATLRNIWACNAEQRILAAVSDKWRWKVFQVMPEVGIGICERGIHFYIYRAMWRRMREEGFLANMDPKIRECYRDEYKNLLCQLWKGLPPHIKNLMRENEDVGWLLDTVEKGTDPLPY